MAVNIGDTLKNRYKIIESLGRGGMADVYKVWDTERSTYLALKLLRDDLAQDLVFMRRFKREAHNLASLQHPNIVRFYGLEVDDLKAFILMEYIEGVTLRERIRRAGAQGIPLEQIQTITGEICGALHYAHKKGLVHCDIKSGNIMLDKSGKAFIMDFGIARGMDAATSTMVGIGTPAYMAPELIRGEDPTPQTDIYALGILLYEMLTGGERPFTGERAEIAGTTAEKVRWEHLTLEPIPVAQFNPRVGPNYQALVERCLQKQPDARFKNVQSLLDLFQGFGNESKKSLDNPEIRSTARKTCTNDEKNIEKVEHCVDPIYPSSISPNTIEYLSTVEDGQQLSTVKKKYGSKFRNNCRLKDLLRIYPQIKTLLIILFSVEVALFLIPWIQLGHFMTDFCIVSVFLSTVGIFLVGKGLGKAKANKKINAPLFSGYILFVQPLFLYALASVDLGVGYMPNLYMLIISTIPISLLVAYGAYYFNEGIINTNGRKVIEGLADMLWGSVIFIVLCINPSLGIVRTLEIPSVDLLVKLLWIIPFSLLLILINKKMGLILFIDGKFENGVKETLIIHWHLLRNRTRNNIALKLIMIFLGILLIQCIKGFLTRSDIEIFSAVLFGGGLVLILKSLEKQKKPHSLRASLGGLLIIASMTILLELVVKINSIHLLVILLLCVIGLCLGDLLYVNYFKLEEKMNLTEKH